LFLSGRGAPTTPSRDEPIHALPENEFLKRIREYNGTPKEIFEHQELMQLMIPILRADFEVCETYRYQPRPALTCPITIFGGLRDSGANRSELEAWREMTSGAFRLRMFPGDHFYLLNSQATVVHTLVRDLHESMTLLNQS
jgi:medium-chain acyl-[acyl-carrier-protein] hydrolase